MNIDDIETKLAHKFPGLKVKVRDTEQLKKDTVQMLNDRHQRRELLSIERAARQDTRTDEEKMSDSINEFYEGAKRYD